MSGEPFSVDLAGLSDVVAHMAELDARIADQLAEVDRIVGALHVSWSGEGAAAHRAAHEEWARGAQEMVAALAALRTVADTAHGNYTRAVETNVRMWP